MAGSPFGQQEARVVPWEFCVSATPASVLASLGRTTATPVQNCTKRPRACGQPSFRNRSAASSSVRSVFAKQKRTIVDAGGSA